MPRPAPALAALITALGTALAPPAHARAGGIAGLADAAAERISVSRDIAAAKWAAGTPIDDPEREAQVLRDTTAQATAAGVPARTARAVVGDQIEASKILQRGLHARWAARPGLGPRDAPGLTEVRPRLDAATRRLIAALAASAEERASPACARTADRQTRAAARRHGLDPLHTAALRRALASACG
ncbi:gamma subclass chorismate mutase AroQ [Nocardiopsis sp. CNT-189]|uniref:gamma subclass chorismate mutase AroQ n=1 Tax=Nocardiopsis oceanisediminis TaxID=2816862 RepID=UPI003B32F960